MKKLKKLLAITLAVVMLISAMPLIQANAADYYFGIMLNRNTSVRLTPNEPIKYLAFYAEKSGYYAFYSSCHDYSDPFVYCYDEDHNLLGYDDNSGGNENFFYKAYLEKDKVYKFDLSAKRLDQREAMYNVSIVNLDERTTDIKTGDVLDVVPNIRRIIEFFRFTPTESGYYAFSSLQKYAFTNAVLYDSEFKYLDEDDDSGVGSSFCLSYYLEGGKTYYYMSTTEMPSNSYQVTIDKCEIVKQINILTYPDKMTYYDGFINEETIDLNGLSAELVYTDGSTCTWTYNSNSWENEIVGTTVYAEITQDENGQFYGYVAADEGYALIDIEVVDCPVKSIEVVSHTRVTCYENISGHEYVDSDTDERWFVYGYDLPRDLVIRINYDDGTYEETRYFDDNNEISFKYYDNQRKGDKWSLGRNTVTLTYYDKECDFYVDVVEIDSLTLVKAPDTVYHFEINSEDENGQHCVISPSKLSGIELQVNLKDGSSKLLTDKDWEEYNKLLDDYKYYAGAYTVDNPQEVLVTLSYCGHEVSYYVPVVEKGDADMDFNISIMDATEIQCIVAKLFEAKDLYIADADRNGDITIMDATAIQMKLAGLA